MTDELREELNPAPYSCAASGCLHDILATRLAAAEAERDAAVARADRLEESLRSTINLAEAYAEGFGTIYRNGIAAARAALAAQLKVQTDG